MIELITLEQSDRERFVKDNQEAFNYGAILMNPKNTVIIRMSNSRMECSGLKRG